jgi:predicted secreted protein
MRRVLAALLVVTCAGALAPAIAQTGAALMPAPVREGTLVLIGGSAEVEVANDEAHASFFVEHQEADAARAQSVVNQRVADGVAALKKADAKAQVESAGYSSYPVYQSGPSTPAGRKLIGWRVRQTVQLRTSDLVALPRAVAAAQQHLALGGIDFRLSRAARERVEAELIQRAVANLNARVAAAAGALQVPMARVRLEEVNFGVPQFERPPIVAMARAQSMSAESVAEPQLDAGRSLQQMSVTAKVRFLDK